MLTLTKPLQTTISYQITTPMFLGGADPAAVDTAHFRNASFKGALRFWWRATQWGNFLKKANSNTEQALQDLHKKEGDLFGIASDGKDSRQSRISIESALTLAPYNKKDIDAQLEKIGYLLGLGLYHFRDKILRDYLPSAELQVRLRYGSNLEEDDILGVEKAAIALGLFGGLGSRSRKGLGSLSIQSLQREKHDEQRFETIKDIQNFLKKLDFSAPSLPPFTALSQATRIDISCQASDALKALQIISNEMQLYRGYGRKNPKTEQHEVNGQAARQIFKKDHDLVLNAHSLKQLPERAVFGLPHNYFFSSTGHKMDIAPEGGGRRASPLFIHVHALRDEQFLIVQSLLPASFLHSAIAIEAKPGKGKTQVVADRAVDYAVIHRYLDGFKNKPETQAHYKELHPHG